MFRRRHFEDRVIVLCVRWNLRYCLTLRNLEELIAERGLQVDHSTIGRWVLRYAAELNKRIRREIRPQNRSWRADETYVPRGRQMDVSVSGCRFQRRNDRFYVVAQARCGRC